MGRHRLLLASAATAMVALSASAPGGLVAQTGPDALSGVVNSREEGKMEGVVVSSRREGATFTVSVVSDARGRYSFPRTHLEPGKYTLAIRAVGYDVVEPGPVDVAAGKTAHLDLSLQKTKDLASQLSSLEWAMSMPGTAEQKDKLVFQLLSCAYCHTYERIAKSKFTAEQFPAVIGRMATYFNDGTALGRGGRGRMQRVEHPEFAEKSPSWGFSPPVTKVELGEYLSTVNLSGGKTMWPYELKTLPRPKGKATRVIMTQYDIPRKETVPHDLEVDAQGRVWLPDQSRNYLWKLDPKTATFTEYAFPPLPQGRVGGVCDPHADDDGNIWFPLTPSGGTSHFGSPAVFDVKTERLVWVEGYPDAGAEALQFLAKGPDGKIWMNSTSRIVSIDPKTRKVDFRWVLDAKALNAPPGPHSIYQTGISSKNKVYALDWLGGTIIAMDPATGMARFFPTPTKGSSPRRGKMDAQDRFWFSEYTGDRIGVFDTGTEQIREWALPLKYTTPYAASSPDRNGYVYSTSNMSERILRLDPKTGEVIEYQVPTDFDSKEIIHDPTTKRVTLWMANTRNARVLKVEPLD